MKNALVFSQTGARNFFIYIIIYEIMGHSHWWNQFSTVPFYILLTTTNPPPFPPNILRSAPPPPPPSTSNSRGFMKRRISTPQNYFRNKLELLHEGTVTLKTYASSVKEHRKLVNCLPIGWIEWKEKWHMIDLRKLVFWLLHLLSSLPVFVL